MNRNIRVPILCPQLPRADKIYPYLQRIDATSQYTNFGPLVKTFEKRLEDLWENKVSVATFNSGTAALECALLSYPRTRGKRCLVPSWTFTATISAILNAGLVPHFMDVDIETWQLDPTHVAQHIQQLGDVGAVVVVAPFGMPIDVSAWENLHKVFQIPVVIDAAASFDNPPITYLPTMISLHATKIFGAGESGALISTLPTVIENARSCSQYGFSGSRLSKIIGTNAKMSEYHAAVSLAALDQWPEMRPAWWHQARAMANVYKGAQGFRLQPGFGQTWIGSMVNVLLDPPVADQIFSHLMDQGIETRFWWSPACHQHLAYRHFSHGNLPNTEFLAPRVIGVPFHLKLGSVDMVTVFDHIKDCFGQPMRQGQR